MSRKPLKATDRRRNIRKHKSVNDTSETTGQGAPLADLFNNRKRRNGNAKRAG